MPHSTKSGFVVLWRPAIQGVPAGAWKIKRTVPFSHRLCYNKQNKTSRGGADMEQRRISSILYAGAGSGGGAVSPLRPGTCRAQPGGQSSGRHCAGRPVYRGRHPERGRRGHPLPGRGEQRPLPGDHQGVYAPDAGGRAGEGLHPPPEAGQRGAVQDHPDGFCRPLPLHPAHHPGQRPGGRAGRL